MESYYKKGEAQIVLKHPQAFHHGGEFRRVIAIREEEEVRIQVNRNGVKGEVWSSLVLVQRESKSYRDCLSSFRRVLRSQEVILWLCKIGFKSKRDLDTIWRIFG
ncbi:hypothetical protein YC2023_060446 [Brassica napus]